MRIFLYFTKQEPHESDSVYPTGRIKQNTSSSGKYLANAIVRPRGSEHIISGATLPATAEIVSSLLKLTKPSAESIFIIFTSCLRNMISNALTKTQHPTYVRVLLTIIGTRLKVDTVIHGDLSCESPSAAEIVSSLSKSTKPSAESIFMIFISL